MKRKVYKEEVRPALLNRLETLATIKRQEAKVEEAEMQMMWLQGVKRLDRIRIRTLKDRRREHEYAVTGT